MLEDILSQVKDDLETNSKLIESGLHFSIIKKVNSSEVETNIRKTGRGQDVLEVSLLNLALKDLAFAKMLIEIAGKIEHVLKCDCANCTNIKRKYRILED